MTDQRDDERFRLAVEAAPSAMILVDSRGTIVLINVLAERLLGCGRAEIVGQPIDRFVPDRFRASHSAHRARFIAGSEQRPMGAGRDLCVLRADGSEVPVEIGLSPIRTADGHFVLASLTDITIRKQIEDERVQLLVREQAARAELERANRLKDEFLALLSHELRTPINAVLGYTTLLRSGVLPAERTSQALEAIERGAQAQARLVDSLLDASRIVAGKLELNVRPLDLRQILDASIDFFRPEAHAQGIALEVAAPDGDLTIACDGARLQQVFWNLLANAVKFTPRGGRISIHAERRDEGVAVRLVDTGKGIHPDFLPHVFDRYRQQPADGAPSGLGLGLALVRDLVHAHGGTVVAESAGEGTGSTFTVTLPSAPPSTRPAPADASGRPRGAS